MVRDSWTQKRHCPLEDSSLAALAVGVSPLSGRREHKGALTRSRWSWQPSGTAHRPACAAAGSHRGVPQAATQPGAQCRVAGSKTLGGTTRSAFKKKKQVASFTWMSFHPRPSFVWTAMLFASFFIKGETLHHPVLRGSREAAWRCTLP